MDKQKTHIYTDHEVLGCLAPSNIWRSRGYATMGIIIMSNESTLVEDAAELQDGGGGQTQSIHTTKGTTAPAYRWTHRRLQTWAQLNSLSSPPDSIKLIFTTATETRTTIQEETSMSTSGICPQEIGCSKSTPGSWIQAVTDRGRSRALPVAS